MSRCITLWHSYTLEAKAGTAISILRILGIVAAVIVGANIFLRLRRHTDDRLTVAILSIFGFSLLLVSLFPGLVNLPAEILSLENSERGRLLTLLILSVIILWLLVIYQHGKIHGMSLGFDKLVRKLAVNDFFKSIQPDHTPSILVIIPAYDEAENLRVLLPALPTELLGNTVGYLVVDDGSSDSTAEVCLEHSIPVLRNMINRGGGAALRAGFDVALELDAQVIVTMDGDGQHQPEDIEGLVAPILNGEADLVIGSRRLGKMERYSHIRYWGVVFFAKMVSMLLGQKVTDPASGFRAINPLVLESCTLTQDQYHTAELIIEASKRGMRIREVPVVIKKRLSGKSKKGKDFKYAMAFLKTIIRTWTR